MQSKPASIDTEATTKKSPAKIAMDRSGGNPYADQLPTENFDKESKSVIDTLLQKSGMERGDATGTPSTPGTPRQKQSSAAQERVAPVQEQSVPAQAAAQTKTADKVSKQGSSLVDRLLSKSGLERGDAAAASKKQKQKQKKQRALAKKKEPTIVARAPEPAELATPMPAQKEMAVAKDTQAPQRREKAAAKASHGVEARLPKQKLDNEESQDVAKALELLLKHRGGGPNGAGRLQGDEVDDFEKALRTVVQV